MQYLRSSWLYMPRLLLALERSIIFSKFLFLRRDYSCSLLISSSRQFLRKSWSIWFFFNPFRYTLRDSFLSFFIILGCIAPIYLITTKDSHPLSIIKIPVTINASADHCPKFLLCFKNSFLVVTISKFFDLSFNIYFDLP